MNRSKKAIYGIITSTLLQIVIIIYGFIVPKIIISNYGSDVNGIIASITQLLSYITLLESGFGPVVLAALYKPIASKNTDTICKILKESERFFRKIAFLFLGYIALLCIIYPLLVNSKFESVFTISMILIIGIGTFAEYFFGMTYKLYLQAKQKTYVISIIQIITYILAIGIIILLAKISVDVHTLKLISAIVFILRPVLQNIYVRKKYNIKFDKNHEKFAIKQKWDGLAQHIAFVIHTNTDITVLTLLAPISEVSVYSVYFLVVTGVKKIILAFTSGIDATFGNMIARGERQNLKNKFGVYETVYYIISVIAFASTIVLITPFINVYTNKIDDANYIRPLFGILLAISEYIWIIRQPYNLLIKAAGHFKETRIGAWVECLSNIIISVILVSQFGIVGVAIGTIVAMTIRTAEFVYHTNKYILKRSIWESIKKILLVVIETVIIVLICNFLPFRENINYLNWTINALMVFGVATVVVLGFNFIFFRKELLSVKVLFKSIIRKRKNIDNQ